jgi:hypothetical protein
MKPPAYSTSGSQQSIALWSEIIGVFHDYSRNGEMIHFSIDHKQFTVFIASPEAESIDQRYSRFLGKKVGIMRTDVPGKRLCFRQIH